MKKLFNLKQYMSHNKTRVPLGQNYIHVRVRQILAFKNAHESARQVFKEEFSKVGEACLTAAEKVVLDESDKQVELADTALAEIEDGDVAMVKSHYICHILLNRAADYFTKL